MKCICMYTPTSSGGHAQYTWELMSALTRLEGVRAELVTSQDLAARFRTTAYPIHQILPPLAHRDQFRTRLGWAANRKLHYPRCERCFIQWLRGRPDIDVVHFQEHTPWRARRFFDTVRSMGKSVFYTVHNVRPHKYPPFIPKHRLDEWDRQSWKACDGLFVLSPRLKDSLVEFLGPKHPPIHVVPHGIWTVSTNGNSPSLVERLGLKRLLFFGAIRRNKGLELLLRAAGSLGEYSLTIAGEPRERDYFESQVLPAVNRLKAAGVRIDLIDRFIDDDELSELFAAHSAVVLPYTAEFTSQSGVVFMALAHDLPVVASNVGGLADLLSEFPVGTTFAENDAEDLARAVRELHAVQGCDRLAAAICAAKRKYSWDECARETLRAYGCVGEPMRACA